MLTNPFRQDESGSSMAEFTIIAGLFFMMIIGIIEFGRLFYTHNALTDAARRGARYATLHPKDAACVKNVVVYGESNIDPSTCAASGPALISGLTAANVVVTYQGSDGNPASTTNAYGMNLGTTTVSITNYTFNLNVPFIAQSFTMPAYTTSLTAESAGTEPTPLP
jgi:Flp pilus assembly protein TadG